MNRFRHISITTRAYHEGLMRWARRLLNEAGLEGLEVYGQFPAKGQTSTHLVFFPYRIGPEAKVQENASGASILRPRGKVGEVSPFVPEAWWELGAALIDAVEATFPAPGLPRVGARTAEASPFPLLSELPAPLRAWYDAAPPGPESWVIEGEEGPLARPPSLIWKNGIVVVARYIIIAHEPGRGSEESTSAAAPLTVGALNVILAGVQFDRAVEVLTPALPLPEGLGEYIESLAAARASLGDEARASRLRAALADAKEPITAELGLMFVQDLNNREIIALMQALHVPLQSSLNVQVRYTLASQPLFAPTAWVQASARNLGRGPAR